MSEDRRLRVLRAIVQDYVQTSEPVGSKALVERHSLGVSPATIRNDMAALEDEGFIAQPHTSAGRVPTDQGYRYYVDHLAGAEPGPARVWFGTYTGAQSKGIYLANLDLATTTPELNMYDKDWPIWTYQEQLPPAKFVFAEAGRRCGQALDSIISPGCIISGSTVVGSVLCPNVRVHSFCQIEQCILMPGVRVGRHARIRRAVVDRDVLIPKAVRHRRAGNQEMARISRTIVNQAMNSREAILSADASSDERFSMAQSIADFSIREFARRGEDNETLVGNLRFAAAVEPSSSALRDRIARDQGRRRTTGQRRVRSAVPEPEVHGE